MGEVKSSNERKNLVIKTLIIVVLLLVAFLSSVIYVFAYPKTTVTLHDDATASYKVLSQFKVKKYSKLGELSAHEKRGYTFLYWAYDDGSVYNPNAELDQDALSLYATRSRNSYTITYHIQVYNEDAEQEGYTSNMPGYRTRTELFGEEIRLPYGTVNDVYGAELLPELRDRVGYHFAGWTTKVAEEEIISASDIYNAGGDFVVPAGDVDLYAYWEKNEYEVIAHTGNEYQMDGLTPKEDEDGKFIIKNNRVQEVASLKYLDAISSVTDVVKPSLSEEDGLVVDGVNIEDYKEYEFKGWYLDENFTIPADAKYTAKVNVVDGMEIPYLIYVDDNGSESIINSVLSGDGKYQFHLYSKWERKSYTVSFNNNHSGSNGKLDPITIYKYDDHYGKFYLHTIDLKDVTTQAYLNSNKGYKFFAWSTTAQTTDPACVTYYQWLQDPISYDANGSIIESKPYYDFFTYRHEISEDRTFYTFWSRIRSVTFYQKNGSNRFNGASFVVEGIAGEWFKLPGTNYVVNKTTGATIGSSWTINDYQYFAGWRVGSGTTGEPILEKNYNGTDNKEYYWIFSSSSTTSVTICAYWESIEYTVEYYMNDGTDNKFSEVKVAGGKKTYYAGAPTRENYIFDGWSTNKYSDNTPKSAKTTYTSSNSFVPRGSERVIRYYASWTMNFTISYHLGVADASVTGSLPTETQYSKKGKDLKLEISVGSGNTLKRTGYTFKGWVLKAQDGSYNTDIVYKAGNLLVFDFEGINVSEGNKQGATYIKGKAAEQYPFFMDDVNTNEVILYAYWEAKEYRITIHNTANGDTIVKDVKYGQDFNFEEHVAIDIVGKKFIGISASETGPILYSKETSLILRGTDIVGDLVFYARYEIREIYITYMIKAEDALTGEDVIFQAPYGYSGYGNKPVLYNDELILPTPSIDNKNLRFTHWYYVAQDKEGKDVQIVVNNKDRLSYDGEELVLWANFVEEFYTMEFKFSNPLDYTDNLILDKDENGNLFLVKKGSGIDELYYDYVMSQLNEYLEARGICEYTLDGIFNTYQGRKYEFIKNQEVNVLNYPQIQTTNVLDFVTVWSANEVKFVYNSGEEAGSQKVDNYHTGKNFESSDSIMLENVTFTDLNDGESVQRWYIKNSSGDKLYLKNACLVEGENGKNDGEFYLIKNMKDYISWNYDNVKKRYVGTVNIYAETQQAFLIEYYRFNKGSLETVGEDSHAYDGYSNILSLMSSSEALKDLGSVTGLVFNGWVVYSSEGRITSIGDNGLVTVGTLTLDTTIFPDFKIFLYADISFSVKYNYLITEGDDFITDNLETEIIPLIKDRSLDYSQESNYLTYYELNSVVSLDPEILADYASKGYEYYGYKIDETVYSAKNIIDEGVYLEVSGNIITILCYITTTRTVKYKLGSLDESFNSSDLASKQEVIYTYVLGYDDQIIAERVFSNATDYTENKISAVTIKDIAVRKEGYIFTGWQQIKDGTVFAEIYKNGDVIVLLDNITFITYFTTPEAGTIVGYIKYLDTDGVLLKTAVEVKNGTIHTLHDGSGTKYENGYKAVYSWVYVGDGEERLVGENFEIPLLITAGQVFEFKAVLKNKYTIAFETYTDNKPDSINTFKDIENQLVGIPQLAEGVEFSHWRYELTHDNGTKEIIKISYNDVISFKESDGVLPVKYSCVAMLGGYNLHIIPVVEGKYVYTLEAVAISEVTIKLTATSTTSTVTAEMTVEYGATYLDPRELLTDEMKALETPDRGICAWTTDPNNTEYDYYKTEEQKAILQKNITKITKKGLELYAVWQTKYTVTYALEDSTFGYKDYTPTTSYYFEGDTVAFDANVVKSIYYKGFNTVYYDNGTYTVHEVGGNDYYYVIGFVASFGGNTTQEYMLKDGSFKMPGNNVTLTPITKTITYRVDFMENAAAAGDTTLYTIYATNIAEIDLSKYSAIRPNFKFLGWHTDPNAELPLTQEELADLVDNKNTILYAVWASNIIISFNYNGVKLFSIPLNKQGKLLESKVEYYMSMAEGSVENGYLAQESLSGSTRTYKYNNMYYYLRQYAYNNSGYETITELCAIDFTISSTVNLMFEQVYTVKYMTTNPTLAEGEEDVAVEITKGYFTALGGFDSTGIVDFAVAEKPADLTNKYYETNGWLDVNNNYYSFEQVLGEDVLHVILQDAEEAVITFNLSWTAKSFDIVLNYTATPYTDFKAHATADDVKNKVLWTNIASTNITDEEGSKVTTTSTVNLVYGSLFVIQFDDEILENYMIVGWSKTLYPLGFYGSEDTKDIIYRMTDEYDMYNYSATYVFDSLFLGEDTSLVLYPVFVAVPSHSVHIKTNNGKFTYTVENDETMKTGYMADLEVTQGSSDYDSQKIELYFYQTLKVIADKPVNEYYKFDTTNENSLVTSIGQKNVNELVIKGTDESECDDFNNCHEEVEITYTVKTITINAKLEYSRELKNHNSTSDTTTVVLSTGDSSVTLSYGEKEASIVVPANGELGSVATIGEHFKLGTIKSSEKSISIVNNKIDVMSLILDENDNAELVISIIPKSFKVSLELQGGSVGDIEYTSELFGNGTIIFDNQPFTLVYDAYLTIPTPTLTKFIFSYWKVNGVTMNEIDTYKVEANLNITAYYIQNSYSAKYYLQGEAIPVDVHFVGGSELTIGKDSEGNLISDNTMAGYKHKGWTEKNKTYDNENIITTEKRDYNFYQIVEGEEVTIKYVYYNETTSETKTLATNKVEYGKTITIPTLAELDENNIAGKSLYGFATTADESAANRLIYTLGQDKLEFKRDLGYEIVDASTLREITLYAVYYLKYVYSIEYGTEDIPTETYEITAINASNEVSPSDLNYKLNTTTPTAPTAEQMFAGYKVAYEINGVTTTVTTDGSLVSAGEVLRLEDPKNHSFAQEIKYILTPQYGAIAGSQVIKLYITDPTNNEQDLEVTYTTVVSGVNEEIKATYYPINALLNNKFFVSSTPSYIYNKDLQEATTVTWTIEANGKTFTTNNASLYAYKLLGFELTYKVGTDDQKVEMLFSKATQGYNIGGGSDYSLRPIWQQRFAVRYYDANNDEITSATEYYDQGTQLKVERVVVDDQNYDRDGFVFVGFARTEDATIKSTSDFYAFEQEFEIVDADYSFYPAYSKIYTINLATNAEILSSSGGDSDKIQVTELEVTTYVGGPLVTLDTYFAVSFNGDGYSFSGFTLVSGKFANELEEKDFIETYTLNTEDLVEDQLYIYVAWLRAEYQVTFIMNAKYKDGTDADSNEYKFNFLYNEEINFEAASLKDKIQAIENTQFVFKNFSYSEGGDEISGAVKVQGWLKIYVNFDFTYTIVYNLGEAQYVSDDVARVPEAGTIGTRGPVGSPVTAYDADENLVYTGLSGLYWTVNIAENNNFFDEYGQHLFTEDDLTYSNNKYEINLYLAGSTAKYTVNLHYFSDFNDLDSSYDKLQGMENKDYSALSYDEIELELDYGTKLLEYAYNADNSLVTDEDGNIIFSSPFNDKIAEVFAGQTYTYKNKVKNIEGISDFIYMFAEMGYEMNGYVVVNNKPEKIPLLEELASNYYTVKTYEGENTYVNDVYLLYSLITYKISTNTYVVDKDADITGTTLPSYSKLDISTKIKINEDNFDFSNESSSLYTTIKDLVVFEPTEESEKENISYNYIGVYSAEYDNYGNITRFIPLKDTDWKKVTLVNSYYIKKSCSVYIFYSEKQVDVTINFISSDNTFDSLALKVKLNDVDADRITTQAENKGLKVTALYGQVISIENASDMPYVISHFIVNKTYKHDQSDMQYKLENAEFGLESITIDVYFEIDLVNVYFFTNTASPFNNGAPFYGEIYSITYESAGTQYIVASEDIQTTYKYYREDSLYYNYLARLPYGAKILDINVNLNNYSVTKWILNNDETNGALDESVLEGHHLKAIFEANTIDVEFYTSNNGYKIEELTITGIKYGSSITLPYAFVEEDLYVSTSWLIGDTIHDWGEETNAVIEGNAQLSDGKLKIYANSINKYYLVFVDERGTGLEIPEIYKNKNSLQVSEYSISMPGTTSQYTYVNAIDINSITCEGRFITGETEIISSNLELPSELQFEDNLIFGGWMTEASNIIYEIYSFGSNHITNEDTHEIKLYLVDSGMVILKFYITNPDGDNIKLSTTANTGAEFNIEYIQVLYNTDVSITSFINPVKDTSTSIVQWGNFFMDDTSTSIFDNYEFHGWSNIKQEALNTPSSEYENIQANSALLYSYSAGTAARAIKGNSVLLEELQALLDKGYYSFYTVWEKKHLVVFNAENPDYKNGFSISGKYAEGQVIPLPNNLDETSEVYKELEYENRKWIGWENSSKTISRLFEECTSGRYTFIVPAEELNMTPIWENGASVIFNINFDQWRKYFAETMSANYEEVTYEAIMGVIGYPFIPENRYEYTSSSTQTINSKTYITSYREGRFWSVGDVIEVYKYAAEFFSQEEIYSLYGSKDYFELVGWYIDYDSDGECDDDELINTKNADGSTILTLTDLLVSQEALTIYALWKPIDVEVKFYYTQADANNGTEYNRYSGVDTVTGEAGYTVVYVPFGGKITSVEDYETDTTIFMYKGYNAYLADYNNIKKMDELTHDQVFYRFAYWSQADRVENFLDTVGAPGVTANTISSPIMDNTNLYPIFVNQYVVEFRTTTNGLISNDIVQYVIDGESIDIKNSIESTVDTSIIEEVYYLDDTDNKIQLMDDGKLVESKTFEVNEFKIINDHYVVIYVHINLVVRAYIPYLEDPVYTEKEINFDYLYKTITMLNIPEVLLSQFGGSEFGGWYYSSYNNNESYYDSEVAYRFNNEDVKSLQVTTDNSTGYIRYYLTLNGSDTRIQLSPADGGLYICLYAQFIVKTTLEIPNQAYGYASLKVSQAESEYYKITNSSTSTKVTYYTVYNSPYAPEITVDLKYGYTISQVSYFDADFNSLFTEDKVDLQVDKTSFLAKVTKSTYNEITTDIETNVQRNNLKVEFVFKISKIKQANMSFSMIVEYIKFNVTYKYNQQEAIIQYYNNGQYYSLPSDANGLISSGQISLNDLTNPLYIGTYSTTFSFTLAYTVSIDGDIVDVKFTGVPYGATLQIIASPVTYINGTNIHGNLKYHFDNWAVSANKVAGINQNDVGEFTANSQRYTPVIFADNELVKSYTITASMLQNEVKEIRYFLTVAPEIEGIWKALVSQLKDGSVKEYNDTYGYVISWSVDFTNGLPDGYTEVKAGNDITNLLKEIRNKYDSQFNTYIATSAIGSNITSLAVLLNYFWFNNSWDTFAKDLDNKICYLEKSGDGKNNIYVNGDGVVTLYSKLSEAILVSTTHQTIDYLDLTTAISVDRANVEYLSAVLPDGQTASSDNHVDIHIISDSTENNVKLKVRYGTSVNFKVVPYGANDQHNSYKISTWNLIGGANDGSIGNSNTITLNTKDNIGQLITVYEEPRPEYRLVANVVVDTFEVNFLNCNDVLIKSVGLGYDNVIAEKGYLHYAYTLDSLYNTSYTLPLFDLDANYLNASLIIKNDMTLFNHPDDDLAEEYGKYKYLFNYWSSSSNGSLYNDVIKNYSNQQYKAVNLYAVYHKNTAIVYTVIGVEGGASGYEAIATEFEYYLPIVNKYNFFEDMFGNQYSDSLLLSSAIKNIEDANSEFDESNPSLYVGSVGLDGTGTGFVSVEKVTTLREILSSSNKTKNASDAFQIYPAIVYDNIIVGHDDSFAVADRREYTITTLGGAYSVNMQDSSLKINNLISITGSSSSPLIEIKSDLTQQFAYWEVLSTSGELEYNVSNAAYILASRKRFNTHFNLKVKVLEKDLLNYGSAKVYKGNTTSGATAGYNNLPLFDTSPSKKYVATAGSGVVGSSDITNVKIYIVIEGYKFRIEERTDGSTSVIYTGEYTLDTNKISSIDKFWWDISFNDRSSGYALVDIPTQKEIALEDAYGSITITPVVANNAEVILEDGLFITNGSTQLNNDFKNYVYLVCSTGLINKSKIVSAGSSMISNGVETTKGNPWDTKLYFIPLNSLATTSDIYIEVNRDNLLDVPFQELAKGTTNYRWQYKIGGTNDWRDYNEGDLANGGSTKKIFIRLACDWKVFKVTLSIMDTFESEGNFTSSTYLENGSEFYIKNGLASNDASVDSNVTDDSGKTRNDTLVFTLLYLKDKIEYDFETETLVVYSSYYQNNIQAKISLSYDSDLYSQGWFNFTNKKDEKILMSSIKSDTTYNLLQEKPGVSGGQEDVYNYDDPSEIHNYVLAAWIEKAVTAQIVADIEDYGVDVVNGHGSIDILEDNIKGDVSNSKGHGNIDKKTPYFTINGGVSTKIKIKAVKKDTSIGGHEFKNITYKNINGSTIEFLDESPASQEKTNETTIIAGEISNNCSCVNYSGCHIHILFDAKPTESTFLVADSFNTIKNTVTTTLYGGYNIKTTLENRGTANELTKVVITDFWGKSTTILIYHKKDNGANTDTATNIFPKANYYINNTVNTIVTAGGLSYNVNQVTVTGNIRTTDTSGKALSDFSLVGSNINYNFMLGLILYVHTIEFDLSVKIFNADGTQTTVSSWNDAYIGQKTHQDSAKNMIMNSVDTVYTISGFNYGDNIGVYYNIAEGYMGMTLGIYDCDDNRIDRLFVKNNTSYSLKGLDIYSSTISSTVLVEGDYYSTSNSLSILEGTVEKLPGETIINYFGESNLPTLRQCKYVLMVRIQERTESKISFQLNLPYVSDITNLDMKSNLVDKGVFTKDGFDHYAVQNNLESATYHVENGVVFNMLDNGENVDLINKPDTQQVRNIEHNLIVGRGFNVKLDGSNLIFYDGNTSYGYINITIPLMYEFIGWYTYANNGIDCLNPSTNNHDRFSYKVWAPRTTAEQGATKVGSDLVSIDSDTTIYLVLKRKPITIKYDNGEWWLKAGSGVGESTANYDINTMLKYSYMESVSTKFNGTTTLTYPGGLVTVVPSDIKTGSSGDAIFQAVTNYTASKKALEFLYASSNPNAVIRSGLYISCADSDVLIRAQAIINDIANGGSFNTPSTLITCTNSAFTKGKSMAIVGGMSTDSKATEFDVLLTGSNTWNFVGVPTGDAIPCSSSCNCNVRKVNMYQYPQGDSNQALIGTYSFEADAIRLLQSLAVIPNKDSFLKNKQNSTDVNFNFYISKNTSSRLYDGLYFDKNGLRAPSKSYSAITINYNCPNNTWTALNGKPSNERWRAILSGYKIVVSSSTFDFDYNKTNQIYEDYIYEGVDLEYYGTCGCGRDYSVVNIYPIWQILPVYTVTIVDGQSMLGFAQTSYSLDGEPISYQKNGLTQVEFASNVSTTNYGSTLLYTLQKGNLVFSGMRQIPNTSSVTSAYISDINDPTEFTNYGVLRVVNNHSTYTVKQGRAVSGAKYGFTISPNQDIVLGAIWLKRGYTVKYKYNGILNSNIGTIDINKSMSSSTEYTINYANLLEGTPIRVSQSFSLSNINGQGHLFEKSNVLQGINTYHSISVTDACSIDGYTNNVDNVSLVTNSLIAYGSIRGADTSTCTGAVIGFSLRHDKGHTTNVNGSMISNSTMTTTYTCSSNEHAKYEHLDWNCYFCTYTDESGNRKIDARRTYSSWYYYNDTKCAYDTSCYYCNSYLNTTTENHSHNGSSYTVTQNATCTNSKLGKKNCSKCGSQYGNVVTISGALGHNYGSTSTSLVNSADCTDGVNNRQTCSRCSNVKSWQTDPYSSHNINTSISGITCGGSATRTCSRCTTKQTISKPHRFDGGLITYYSQKVNQPDPWHCNATLRFVKILCSDCGKSEGTVIRVMKGDKSDGINNQIDSFVTSSDMHDRAWNDTGLIDGSKNCKYCGVQIKKDTTSGFWNNVKSIVKSIFSEACYVSTSGSYNTPYSYIMGIWWKTSSTAYLYPTYQSGGLFYASKSTSSSYLPPVLKNNPTALKNFTISLAAVAGFTYVIFF